MIGWVGLISLGWLNWDGCIPYGLVALELFHRVGFIGMVSLCWLDWDYFV